MSCIQGVAAAAHPGHHRSSVSHVAPECRLRRTLPAHFWHAILRWASRARQRRDLAALDSHLLGDIGLTESQARREAAKPFWVE